MKYPIRTEQQILIYVTMDLEEKRETRHGDTCFLAAIRSRRDDHGQLPFGSHLVLIVDQEGRSSANQLYHP